MNYIPGFSNYLAASVPEYGPAPIVAAEPVVPQRAAVMPMTQEAAPAANAPLTLAQLASVVSPGRDPSQREQIIASQNLKATPYSINNYLEYGNGQGVAGGKPTTTGMYEGHNYTLVDNKTGTILAQGSTPEEIQKIQEIANNLSTTQGKNADWRLYDANPSSGITNMHETMPGEYLDLSVPGDPRGVVVAGNMPNNVFKDFIIPALTPLALAAGAYFGGGALLGQAAGGGAGAGLGATATGAGTAATGGLTASQMSALGAQLAANFGPATAATAGAAASSLAPIVVTGGGATTGLGALPALAGGIASTLPALGNLPMDPALMQPEVTPEDIVVSGNKAIPKTVVPDVLEAVGPILPQLGIPQVPTPDPALTEADKKLTAKEIADYLRLASLGVSTVGGLLEGGGGGSGGTIPTGMGALSSLFNKQLPTSTLPRGGALPASTLASQGLRSPQDYYRYGYGPEQSFFDYATQGAPNTSRAYTGYEGSTAEDAFAPQPMRAPQVALPQVALPQPITTPIPNNPAGPSMYAPAADDMRFARGGFAVEGAGDGRDDKIPALLSDGEYVIDAETVALLGNGSNKAGAKLLDNFRVKVRKQKGKKLARGEFSDNAKRPEHYMAGGYA